MESDMVAAVRHRAVPGDLTRSSTCNKTNAIHRFLPESLSPSRAEFAGIHRAGDAIGATRKSSNSSRDTCCRRWGIEQQVEADVSSRHHARRSTRVIRRISELSAAPFSSARISGVAV